MATPPKGTDRRVRRTRQMIRQAFLDVVREKGLLAASVQEVVARANISRGTFYAHYADKYELVDSIVREEFQRALGTLDLASGWNRHTLFLLIQTVLAFFKTMYQQHHRSRELAPILEKVIHEELSAVLLALLKHNNLPEGYTYLLPETIAQVLGWTIFGAAVQWSQTTSTSTVSPISAEQMAHDIERLILDGLIRFVPDAHIQPDSR